MLRYASRIIFGGILFAVFIVGAGFGNHASAVSGSDWNAGKIISDDLFFKADSMSASDIQNFLNSMVPVCDTWGTQPSEFGGGTRRQWAEARGYYAPFTCLKDYQQDGKTAAQIIKEVSDLYGISPKVIIVLLQKEQSLVTDTWPLSTQYRTATGYGCPDTAPCDAEYFGFTNQVTKAAFQFKRYATNPAEYRYKAYQQNYIQWNPSSSCGGSNVFIQNQSTAGLYNYTPYQPNASALANLYGSGDGCGAYGNRNFWRMYNDWFGSTQYEEKFLSYQSHIGGLGWVGPTTNSGITGTVGQGRPMEAFKINGLVEYTSYNNTTGWQPTVRDGMVSGTTGLSRAIQAVKITPLDSLVNKYDVYYRVHVSGVGWMGWAKNGQPAGTTGNSTRNIEAIELRLILKGYTIGDTGQAFSNMGTTTYNPAVSVGVNAHVQNVGWQPPILNDMVAGTMNQSLRIEALKLNLNNNSGLPGSIIYSAHVQNVGWQPYMSDGAVSGTINQGLRAEAIRIALTGQLGDNYDVWYSAYIQNYGWMGWAKNGQPAGSLGPGLRMEALMVRIVPKGSMTVPSDNTYLYNPANNPVADTFSFSYSTHLSNIGWTGGFSQDQIGGTVGQGRAMEALRFDSTSSILGSLNVACSAYIKGTGWVENISTGSNCGTVGQGKPLEAIKLQFAGEAASKYDIYYKVHLSALGWQEWVKNGVQTGTPNSGKNIEAVTVRFVQK